MAWYWYLFYLFFALISFVLYSEIIVNIIINKKSKNDFIEIHIWLFYKFIHLKKKIPMVLFESMEEGIKFKSETVGTGVGQKAKKDRISPKKVKKWHKQFYEILTKIHDFYFEIKKLLTHVKLEEFKWVSMIGTGNAMETGIMTGMMWSFKGILLGIITKYVDLKKKPYLTVDSDFHHKVYNSRFECILKIRVGYVILTGIRLSIKLIKGAVKNGRRASYSRINENSYGKY